MSRRRTTYRRRPLGELYGATVAVVGLVGFGALAIVTVSLLVWTT